MNALPAERRRPRVCFVNLGALAALAPGHEAQAVGGEEVQHALLSSALAAEGWEVSLVTHDLGQRDGAVIDGVRVYGCYPPEAGWPGLRFVHPRWSGLDAALRRADADVYYTSNAGALTAQVAWHARRHGRAMVFRVASDTDCDPARVLVRTARERALYHWGLARSDAVLAQTPLQAELLRRHHGIEATVAPMLLDVPASSTEADRRDIDVLWVANLRALKRPAVLLEAARALPEWRFHLVGGEVRKEPEVAREVREAAARLPNVVLHGRVGYRDTLALFARTRLFASTSLIEGFPNTFLQAWAHGVPTVSFFDPDGVVERHGLGLRVRGEGAFAVALDTLLDDAALRARMSAACRCFTVERYRREALLAPYVQTFSTLA